MPLDRMRHTWGLARLGKRLEKSDRLMAVRLNFECPLRIRRRTEPSLRPPCLAKVRNVKAKRVQVDEIWSFTAGKQKNVAGMKKPVDGAGDTWTWTAIEAQTKLIISHFVAGRDGDCAAWFIQDVADRVANCIQLTSDGHKAYLDAVEGAFAADIDYAMLVKIYGASSDDAEGRYSPAECIGAQKRRIEGKPDMARVSTFYSERANLTMRMSNKRFSRLTNTTRTWS